MTVRILQGDCREVMRDEGPFDMIIADPPYGDTALSWDKMVRGWERVAHDRLKPTGSIWVFGSLRFFMLAHRPMRAAKLRVTQEIVWEKHNGSGFAADRFKRVHELAVQLIRADAEWRQVYNDVQKVVRSGPRKTVRSRGQTAHTGLIGNVGYEDDGSRIVRSVIYAPSCQGKAIHPTEKPVSLLETLIRTSCPGGGLVGDFFAGSGAAGEAAALAGRNYVGCELDESYAAAAEARLSCNLFVQAAE